MWFWILNRHIVKKCQEFQVRLYSVRSIKSIHTLRDGLIAFCIVRWILRAKYSMLQFISDLIRF